jgi:hypothetical protein
MLYTRKVGAEIAEGVNSAQPRPRGMAVLADVPSERPAARTRAPGDVPLRGQSSAGWRAPRGSISKASPPDSAPDFSQATASRTDPSRSSRAAKSPIRW